MVELESRPASPDARLVMTGIAKRFGGVKAITHADFELLPGEVHALVGENGAGKSTLIKILAGAESSDSGSIEMEGQEIQVRSALEAIEHGIATVYQEAQLFGELTVAENIFLGREVTKGGRVDWARQNEQVVELLTRIGLPERYSSVKVEELSAAEQQQVSIAKALSHDARILILDEPSAILTDAEISTLFDAVRKLTASGVSIIYITHRLDELFEIADAVTVMRDGRTIGTYRIGDLSIGKVAELLVGREFSVSQRGVERSAVGDVVLELDGLGSGQAFEDVALTVHEGEVVVLYGLVGSGALDVADCVYGMREVTSGSMKLLGKPYAPHSARQANQHGVAMVPANRKRDGLFSFQPISFNISIGHLPALRRAVDWMDVRKEREMADTMIDKLDIKTPGAAQKVMNLSGGNAQKVVLARAITERPPLLVMAEPSQGVDISAKDEIHRLVEELCTEGTAVLVASSDLGEAIRVADRLIVMRGGAMFTSFGRDARQSDVLAAASGELAGESVQPGGDISS